MSRTTRIIPASPRRSMPPRPVPDAGPVRACTRFWRNYFRFSGRASRSEYWWVTAELLGLALLGMTPRLLRDRSLWDEAQRRRAAGEDVVYEARVRDIVTSQQQETFRSDRRAAEQHQRETERAMPRCRRVLLHLDEIVICVAGIGVCSLEARRLRDAGYRGRSAALGLIPLVGQGIVTWRCSRPSIPEGPLSPGPRVGRRRAA